MVPMTPPRILLVDDEPLVRSGIKRFLEAQAYVTAEADSCKDAEEVFRSYQPDVVIADYRLPDGNALELLPRLKALDPSIPVVILTGYGTIALAVQAVKEGAEHFLTKPVELPALQVILNRMIEVQRVRRNQLVRASRRERDSIDPFVGSSESIRQLEEQAMKILASESPILIWGETGTGKGVLARWLHEHSARRDESFVDLNCAGLTREFLETELFGHEKGAFTGAVSLKLGLYEMAHRGTLFLDEIGDVDVQVQPKLLKALEEKRFRRLGDVRDRVVDARLIVATHHDLGELAKQGRFRKDLYFRINMLPLVTPPLRERKADIPLLAAQLLARIAADLGRGEMRFEEGAIEALRSYAWPGNIRELRNVIERAALFSEGNEVTRSSLRFDPVATSPQVEQEQGLTLAELERQYILKVLDKENGRIEAAAERLGIPRSTLYHKVKQYRLDLPKH
jgi:DNA-binding NtrC family response regulator